MMSVEAKLRRISVVVVTFNPDDALTECLERLSRPSEQVEVEIIVVDNGSTNGAQALIQGNFPHVKLILNHENKGFGAANNIGAEAADSEWLAFVNPDLLVTPSTLTKMADYLAAHLEAGAVGPRTLDGTGQVMNTAYPRYTPSRIAANYLRIARIFPALQYGRLLSRLHALEHPTPVHWLQGSCLLIRRAVFEKVGGFDEGFFLYSEDADLCDRIGDAGFRVVYLPEVCVTHTGGTTTRRYHAVRVRSLHLSPLYYFRKRNRPFAVVCLKIVFAVELLVKISVRSVVKLIRNRESLSQRISAEWTTLFEIWRA